MKELGKLNYEAYRAARCKVIPNIPFDSWEELLDPQRDAWNAGANAVLIEVTAAVKSAEKKEP